MTEPRKDTRLKPLHALDPSIRKLSLAVLAIDLLLIATFVGLTILVFSGFIAEVPWRLRIETDRGVAGFWGYTKWAVLTGVLVAVWWRRAEAMFPALAAIFLMLLLDDALEGHERLGMVIAETAGVSETAALRPQDFGELAAFALMGACAAVLFTAGFLRSGPEARRQGLVFAGLIAALALFGVGADVVHIALVRLTDGTTREIVDPLGAVVEDGGELIVATAILTYALHLLRCAPPYATRHLQAGAHLR